MAKFTFVPYSIRVRKKREEDYLKLGILKNSSNYTLQNSEAVDFSKIFIDFLTSLTHYSEELDDVNHAQVQENAQMQENASQDESSEDSTLEEDRDLEGDEEERIIVIKNFDLDTETGDIRGVFLAGDAEESSEAYNPASGERLFTIKKGLALARPFYFRIKVSELSDKGILVLQTFKKYGIKDILEKEFNNYIKEKHDDLIIEMNTYVPKDVIEYYLSQRVFEVQLIKFGFPSEIRERNMDAIPEEELETISQGQSSPEEKPNGKTIMLFKADKKHGFPTDWINKLKGNIKNLKYDSDGEIRNLVEIQNFEYDNVKIRVKIGENVRTINLAKKDKIRYNEELDKDDRLIIDGATGHPKFESIRFAWQRVCQRLR